VAPKHFDEAYEGLMKRLPAAIAGRVDLLRPAWGGGMNGQEWRREIVRGLAKLVDFDLVLETGTYRGTSTEFLLAVFGCPVHTVELDLRLFFYSSRRLNSQRRATIELGDSRSFLRRLADRPDAASETVFIYLDAHGNDDLPLVEELQIVSGGWPRAVVMIDDFQVPGDAGYGYDDWGPGRALTEDLLPATVLGGWSLSYPSAVSEHETGAKRGCCVLASPLLIDAVRLPTLREARIFRDDLTGG
jgi:predicted O-methyltransferase YrrM